MKKSSESKKGYSRSCFGCRNSKAIATGMMPCKRCHDCSNWKPLTDKQFSLYKKSSEKARTSIEKNGLDTHIILSGGISVNELIKNK